MSNYSLLLDVARVRQAELVREAQIARLSQIHKRNRKTASLAKKSRTLKELRTFLASIF